jgi:hypothetical protein
LRKLFVGALAATATLAMTGAAVGQGVTNPAGDATFDATVSPAKAGTKANPRGHSLRADLTVSRPGSTVEVIEVLLSKKLKMSGKGLKTCSQATLEGGGPTACSPASAAGPLGSATALIEPGNSPLNFDVYPFVRDATTLMFYLDQQGGGVQTIVFGRITNSGRKLAITIPENLRRPAGLNATLTGIDQTFRAKRGKNNLVSSIGCKNRKHKVTGRLVFAQRTDTTVVPPPEALTDKVRCTK